MSGFSQDGLSCADTRSMPGCRGLLAVVASPLLRARQTAQPAASAGLC